MTQQATDWGDLVGHRVLVRIGYEDWYDSAWSSPLECRVMEVTSRRMIRIQTTNGMFWRDPNTIRLHEDLGASE